MQLKHDVFKCGAIVIKRFLNQRYYRDIYDRE